VALCYRSFMRRRWTRDAVARGQLIAALEAIKMAHVHMVGFAGVATASTAPEGERAAAG